MEELQSSEFGPFRKSVIICLMENGRSETFKGSSREIKRWRVTEQYLTTEIFSRQVIWGTEGKIIRFNIITKHNLKLLFEMKFV